MTEHLCPLCDTAWNTSKAAEACEDRCAEDDGLTGFDPSRTRLSYLLSYD